MKTRPFQVKDGVLQSADTDKTKRVTLLVPPNLDLNIELYALVSKSRKMDVIAAALVEFLKKGGIPDPLAAPEISWKT